MTNAEIEKKNSNSAFGIFQSLCLHVASLRWRQIANFVLILNTKSFVIATYPQKVPFFFFFLNCDFDQLSHCTNGCQIWKMIGKVKRDNLFGIVITSLGKRLPSLIYSSLFWVSREELTLYGRRRTKQKVRLVKISAVNGLFSKVTAYMCC